MTPEFVRNPYNYDSDIASNDTGLMCLDESLTEQEHLAESDINYIADKFMRTGEAPQVLNMPTHGDFDGIFDFQTAMNTIKQAKDEFMALPAKTRSRFSNDPAELIAFIEDPTNRDEAIKLGFIPKPDIMNPPLTTEVNNGIASSRSAQGNPESSPGASRTQKTAPNDETTQKP